MPKNITANEIRQSYIDFFAKRGHTVVPSSSLVPGGDATLLFANSGMVQFKDVFLGTDKRPYKRAVDTQKCLRVAGKHNDLDDVGFDDTHHTFFEMLGNWSFGDYYKKEAIAWAWELLTKEWKLSPDRLYLTIFKDDQGDIPTDDEAAEAWAKQPGVDKSHIIYSGRKDNFWEMADTGPCGPNSEIHYDLGPEKGEITYKDGVADMDGPRFTEIWNLVFIQYNRTGPKELKPLPAKHVDTGMGFERMVSILQNVQGNYRTDLFMPIIEKIQELAGQSNKERDANFTPYRVVADHSRAATFLIADGVVPGNVGRNYIARMIIRRAARFGSKLGLNEPFMAALAEVIIKQYGEAYPELKKNRKTILENLTREEERFQRTLEGGLAQLETLFAGLGGKKILGGEQAFELYATHGLPFEITRDIARERGLDVDEASFRSAMEQHKEISIGGKLEGTLDDVKLSSSGTTDRAEFYLKIIEKLQKAKKLPKKGVKYDPYHELEAKGTVLALVNAGKPVKQAKAGDKVAVILPATPFYIASGGQISDTGTISSATGKKWTINITDTQRPAAGAVVHIGEVVSGSPKVGDKALAQVDRRRRQDIMRNHTATHLLHAALHEVVGEHARQAGSLVAPDRLRFDFTNPEGLSKAQRIEIEEKVNGWILDNYELHKETKPLEKAKKEGAMALFGEKYGAEVRTIAIGENSLSRAERGSKPFSYELCGGTHVEHTGDIGLFLIISEGSAAAGIRRIEAVTGRGAYALTKARNAALAEAAGVLKTAPENVPYKVVELQNNLKNSLKILSDISTSKVSQSMKDLLEDVETIKGVSVLTTSVPGADVNSLQVLGDLFREKYRPGVALLIGTQDGFVSTIAIVTKELVTKDFNANDLLKRTNEVLGGKGGGKPDLARGGGGDNGRVAEALAAAKTWVEAKLSAK
jgi:alanyl-tRNA synthetase